mgnify:CR=1 FL=1
MKTLKLGSLAAIVACLTLFTACTKDISSTPSDSSTSQNAQLSNKGKGGNEVDASSNRQSEPTQIAATAAFDLSFNPAVAMQGQDVNLVAKVNFSDPVKQLQCIIEYSTDGSNWVNYRTIGIKEVESISTYTFDTTFNAETIGVTYWRVHLAGKDVAPQQISNVLRFEVKKACNELKLIAQEPVGVPSIKGGNWYDFTVTYKVSSCKALQNAKLQGGLTAFSTAPEALDANDVAGTIRKMTNNENYIINWSLNVTEGYENTFTIKFSKELKGEGSYQITGGWSVEGIDAKTGETIRVDVPEVYFSK